MRNEGVSFATYREHAARVVSGMFKHLHDRYRANLHDSALTVPDGELFLLLTKRSPKSSAIIISTRANFQLSTGGLHHNNHTRGKETQVATLETGQLYLRDQLAGPDAALALAAICKREG